MMEKVLESILDIIKIIHADHHHYRNSFVQEKDEKDKI